MSNMNWRDKDDLDLTSEDIDAMIADGQSVAVRGPRLPGHAAIVTAAQTFGGATVQFTPKQYTTAQSFAVT